jgi:hypothetical protein
MTWKSLPFWTSSRVRRLKERKEYRNHYLLKKDIKKIDHEFDAINIIKLMKQVKLMASVLLNPIQKMLLGFQKQNVIDSDSSDGIDSDEDDVKVIQKMKSSNTFIKLMTVDRIKKELSQYLTSSKLKEVDQRLINGITVRHSKKSSVKS